VPCGSALLQQLLLPPRATLQRVAGPHQPDGAGQPEPLPVVARHQLARTWDVSAERVQRLSEKLPNAENRDQLDKERNALHVLRCMCLLYESVRCAIRRERVLPSRCAAAQAQRGDYGPFGNPSQGLSPLDLKESALLCLYRLVPQYGPCSVSCMRFVHADRSEPGGFLARLSP
jgi:hypothetical protein